MVRERLEADHLFARFDKALLLKAQAILANVDRPEEWETMTRGRRNLAPQQERGTTVNVSQQASAQAAAVASALSRVMRSMRFWSRNNVKLPTLDEFFVAHGILTRQPRVVRPFHRRIFQSVTQWVTGTLPGGAPEPRHLHSPAPRQDVHRPRPRVMGPDVLP